METVLGLLLVLLPLIFKAVEKKLKASGKPVKKSGSAGLPEEDFEPVREISGLPEIAAVQEEPATAVAAPVAPTVSPAVSPAVSPTVSPAVSPAPEKKLDPKKLVVYSEIMKPKYTEQ